MVRHNDDESLSEMLTGRSSCELVRECKYENGWTGANPGQNGMGLLRCNGGGRAGFSGQGDRNNLKALSSSVRE